MSMSKASARSYIASMLAANTAEHVFILKEIPSLEENTMQAAGQNRDAAIALGIDDLYTQKLFIHMRGLWDLLSLPQL